MALWVTGGPSSTSLSFRSLLHASGILQSSLQTFLYTHGRLSRAQFAMWAHTSVADVLQVVHDRFLLCWSRDQQAWLVLHEVIHAFGSRAHATVQNTLLAAGYSASQVDLLVFAIRSMLLHMGGYQGVEEALARYEAGLGQGDPISALLYCLLGELCAALALASMGLLATTAGPLRRLGWIDDTSLLAASHADAQRLVSRLPTSEAATDLFSDNVKTIAIGTELCLGRLHILNAPLYLLGVSAPAPGAGRFHSPFGTACAAAPVPPSGPSKIHESRSPRHSGGDPNIFAQPLSHQHV